MMKSNRQVLVWFLGIGGILGILSWFIAGAAKNWVGGIGLLALAGGLVVFLADTIAKRKEWKAVHKVGTK
jgi:hypothetical protein